MKKFLLLTLFSAMLLTVSAKAQASSWSIVPTGPLDTEIGDTVAFDLFLDVDGPDDIWSVSMALDFAFDANELAYQMNEVTSPIGTIFEPVVDLRLQDWTHFVPLAVHDGKVDLNIIAPLAQTYGTQLTAGTQLHIATFYFDVIADEFWDGLADFELLAQIGNKGIGPWSADGTAPFMNLDGAQGADVGSPVPIPGAFILLGSGLLGLISIRRRKK